MTHHGSNHVQQGSISSLRNSIPLWRVDDKGDVSAETTGPAPAEVSAGTQISAERLAVLLAYCHLLITAVVRISSSQDKILLHLLSR
ncbi:hypothetical protein V6N12_013030 [Hibiscus sabdariffa]|uniref:Uncharacterized protein n=1 Tax=Hibiscus sabdariffa TaxID=183260 RepID=A0ABR2EG57_9ROSI